MRPREEIIHELVQQWLDKAEGDWGLAEHLLAQGGLYPDAIAFHCQQAAEKYLKAFLTRYQVEFPKTHDLTELLDLVATIDQRLSSSLTEITQLTAYGVTVRYPGESPQVTEQEALMAVNLATKTRETIYEALRELPGLPTKN